MVGADRGGAGCGEGPWANWGGGGPLWAGPFGGRGCKRLACKPCPLLGWGRPIGDGASWGKGHGRVGWPAPPPDLAGSLALRHSDQSLQLLQRYHQWLFIYVDDFLKGQSQSII